MDHEVHESRMRITRRRALAAGGSVALTALLAGCGLGGRGAGDGTATVITSDGGSATVQPTVPGGADDVVALLDAAPTCGLTEEQTEGPYYLDVDAIRSDIRDERPGATLRLALRVQDVSACATGGAAVPVPDSVVEIWHCDAGGIYSGFASASVRAGGDTDDAAAGDDARFLRGAQVADADGVVRFTTIYPGWYRGRTVHIHLKVHMDRTTVLTTQLYFDESITSQVFADAPYDVRGEPETTNGTDSIYTASGLLTLARRDDGWLGVTNLGVDL